MNSRLASMLLIAIGVFLPGSAQYTAFPIDPPASSPGNSLTLQKANAATLTLNWTSQNGARGYNVKRCAATSCACTPAAFATVSTNSHYDSLTDPGDSWYLIESVNACGAVP